MGKTEIFQLPGGAIVTVDPDKAPSAVASLRLRAAKGDVKAFSKVGKPVVTRAAAIVGSERAQLPSEVKAEPSEVKAEPSEVKAEDTKPVFTGQLPVSESQQARSERLGLQPITRGGEVIGYKDVSLQQSVSVQPKMAPRIESIREQQVNAQRVLQQQVQRQKTLEDVEITIPKSSITPDTFAVQDTIQPAGVFLQFNKETVTPVSIGVGIESFVSYDEKQGLVFNPAVTPGEGFVYSKELIRIGDPLQREKSGIQEISEGFESAQLWAAERAAKSETPISRTVGVGTEFVLGIPGLAKQTLEATDILLKTEPEKLEGAISLMLPETEMMMPKGYDVKKDIPKFPEIKFSESVQRRLAVTGSVTSFTLKSLTRGLISPLYSAKEGDYERAAIETGFLVLPKFGFKAAKGIYEQIKSGPTLLSEIKVPPAPKSVFKFLDDKGPTASVVLKEGEVFAGIADIELKSLAKTTLGKQLLETSLGESKEFRQTLQETYVGRATGEVMKPGKAFQPGQTRVDIGSVEFRPPFQYPLAEGGIRLDITKIPRLKLPEYMQEAPKTIITYNAFIGLKKITGGYEGVLQSKIFGNVDRILTENIFIEKGKKGKPSIKIGKGIEESFKKGILEEEFTRNQLSLTMDLEKNQFVQGAVSSFKPKYKPGPFGEPLPKIFKTPDPKNFAVAYGLVGEKIKLTPDITRINFAGISERISPELVKPKFVRNVNDFIIGERIRKAGKSSLWRAKEADIFGNAFDKVNFYQKKVGGQELAYLAEVDLIKSAIGVNIAKTIGESAARVLGEGRPVSKVSSAKAKPLTDFAKAPPTKAALPSVREIKSRFKFDTPLIEENIPAVLPGQVSSLNQGIRIIQNSLQKQESANKLEAKFLQKAIQKPTEKLVKISGFDMVQDSMQKESITYDFSRKQAQKMVQVPKLGSKTMQNLIENPDYSRQPPSTLIPNFPDIKKSFRPRLSFDFDRKKKRRKKKSGFLVLSRKGRKPLARGPELIMPFKELRGFSMGKRRKKSRKKKR